LLSVSQVDIVAASQTVDAALVDITDTVIQSARICILLKVQ